MQIPFRVKFFVVLLAFSLGPLLISRTITGRAAAKVEKKVAADTRTEMMEIVGSELVHNAVSLRDLLEAHGQAMALSVRALAGATHNALDRPSAENLGPPLYASGIEGMHTNQPDMVPSQVYLRKTGMGKDRPMDISLERPAFRMPPELTATDAATQTRQLQSLLPTFRMLSKEWAGLANWYNVGLESGLFATYPGHGHFPIRYDHRQEEWYKRTQEATDTVVWTSPAVDPASGNAVTIASLPIRDADGNFIGAVSMDMPIGAMFENSNLRSQWSEDIQSFMVVFQPQPETDRDGLLIVAKESYSINRHRQWRVGIEAEWMASDDPKRFDEFVTYMSERESGIMRLPFKGVDSFWAFASSDGFSFLLIVPATVVSELPNYIASSVTRLLDDMRDISAIISGIMLCVIGIIAWFGSNAVTRPLIAMAGVAKRLAQGDFSVRMTRRTGDERDVLIDSFNDMVPKLQERMQMRRDLELAQGVQSLLLPSDNPALPGFDISGGIAYCDQTGGDYYDFINAESEEGHCLGVVIGDVSGHGVPAALIMAAVRGQLHSLSRTRLTPAQRINTINGLLSRDLDGTGRFLTMFYIRLQENSPAVQWVRAGHDPAIRYNPAMGTFDDLGGEGLALGVTEDFIFQEYETSLETGEVLAMATDGVWEARNEAGEMFGKQRVLAIIRENAHKCAEDIRLAIMDAVAGYETNGQEDDIAVVIIKKD